MLKRIQEWRPFNRREPTVTDEEHWHSAEQLYGAAEAFLARHKHPSNPHRPLILEPGQTVVRGLNPYEIAAVRQLSGCRCDGEIIRLYTIGVEHREWLCLKCGEFWYGSLLGEREQPDESAHP